IFYVYFTQHLAYDSIDYLRVDAAPNGNSFLVDDQIVDDGVSSTNPMEIVLNTGTGDDNIQANAASHLLTINGQGGQDEVNLGSAQYGTQNIRNSVMITNALGISTLNIDDRENTQGRSISIVGNSDLGSIRGFTPIYPGLLGRTSIRYTPSDVLEVN